MSPEIPKNELEKRGKVLRERLLETSTEAIIIPLGIYFEYFFGKTSQPSERLIVGVISVHEDPFILCPAFEATNLQRSTFIDDFVTWDETESPYEILAHELDQRGIGETISSDPKLWLIEAERIEKTSGRKIMSGHELLGLQRQIKSDWEVKQLKMATKASAEGILNSLPKLREGMTEIQFVHILRKELSERSGNPLSFGIVQFGENSAIPHGRPTSKKLTKDTVVLVDAGTSVNGYQGDITITVPFGQPYGFKDIYEIVYEANRIALENNGDGVIAGNLDRNARKVIGDAGYGKYFTHRLGHGLGMEVHEEPYIVETNRSPLQSGNCHTIEPGIYLPGKFGIRIEDDVVVTGNGAELLYPTPRYNFDLI